MKGMPFMGLTIIETAVTVQVEDKRL